MAFEITDYEHHYVPRGDDKGVFNVVREDSDDEGLKFYAYMNEAGSYFIQRLTTSGTIKIYEYYAVRRRPDQLSSDFSNRASLSYVEFYQLFPACT
jgi:hypothetical protein